MSIKNNSSNLLIDQAYRLWQKIGTEEPCELAQEKIVHQLFLKKQQERPLLSWYYSFVELAYPSWMKKKVKLALGAYKFDLIAAGKHNSHLNLFTNIERWFIDQKLVGIFRNVIFKDRSMNIKEKSVRLKEKAKKYYNKRELMIGSYILNQLGQKFPNYKKSINWMKILNIGYIENHSKETFKNINDETIVKGLTEYLEKPFDKTKSITRIFSEIVYFIAKAKTTSAINTTFNAVTGTVSAIGESILSGVCKVGTYAWSSVIHK